MMKKNIEITLPSISCRQCFDKLLEDVQSIKGVVRANVDQDHDKLLLTIRALESPEKIMSQIYSVLGRIPSKCTLHAISLDETHAFSLLLEGLHCASCASKIEKRIQQLEGVCSAQFNIASKKMSLQINIKKDKKKIIAQAEKIIHDMEPGVIVQASATGRLSGWKFFTIPKMLKLLAGLGCLLLAFLVKVPFLSMILYIAAYLVFGWQVVYKAIRNVIRGEWFDEYFLMSIATLGALAIGEYPEAVAVMLFFWVGDQFQQYAVHQSRQSIESVLKLRPDKALIRRNGEEVSLDPEKVRIGDILIVKPGERVSLDGTVVEGSSTLDLSALTGESVPLGIGINDKVLSGSINLNALLHLRVDQLYENSTMNRILQLVESAAEKKATTEQLITRLSKYYTPLVVSLAAILALVFPWLFPSVPWNVWLYRSFVFLVVSCPCALVISIPLSFFSGIGAASKEGVLIKGGNYLEALNQVKTILFDKTGTLTHGQFKVSDIQAISQYTSDDILYYAALAEKYSTHPFAYPILQAYEGNLPENLIIEYQEISGQGIRLSMDKGTAVLFGNKKLMEAYGVAIDTTLKSGFTGAYLSIDGVCAGYIALADELREEAGEVVNWLKSWGVRHLGMLTGDQEVVAGRIRKNIQLDSVYAELMPQEKADRMSLIRATMARNEKVMFVGDGLNDAPVLAQADIGVAMGAWGSDAAIASADIVMMHNDLRKLTRAFEIARRTRTIIWQNIVFALAVKGLVLLLGALGYAGMWEAVFADVGVTLIAVLNAMRIFRRGKRKEFV